MTSGGAVEHGLAAVAPPGVSLRDAEALIAAIDRLPAPEGKRAIGSDAAQAALALIAKAKQAANRKVR